MAKRTKAAEQLAANETTKTAATVRAETKTADARTAENISTRSLIYVGADLPGIKANTVFTGELPKILDVPFVRELVIPVDGITEFLKKKAVTESRAAFCYRKSVEYAESLKR